MSPHSQISCPCKVLSITMTVQSVSSERAVTVIYTSSPVGYAFCLSADAVNPSIFPSLLTMFLLLIWTFTSLAAPLSVSDLFLQPRYNSAAGFHTSKFPNSVLVGIKMALCVRRPFTAPSFLLGGRCVNVKSNALQETWVQWMRDSGNYHQGTDWDVP